MSAESIGRIKGTILPHFVDMHARLWLSVLVIFSFVGGSVQAASYMKLGDIKGETVEIQPTEVEVTVIKELDKSSTKSATDNGGITAEDDWETPVGAADGSGGDVTVVKELDKSSPKLQESACNGVDDDCDGVADTGGTEAIDEWEEATATGDGTKDDPDDENRAAYIKIGDIKGEAADKSVEVEWKVEEGEKAAVDGYIKIGDIKGESDDKSHDTGGDVTVVKELDKSSPKLQESACDGQDDDCDGAAAERTKGETTLGDVTVVKELDKSSPKLQESCTGDDCGEGEPEERAAYIKIGDIKGEAADHAIDPDSDNDGLDDSDRAPGNHNTTRSNKTQPAAEEGDDVTGDGELEVEADSTLRVEDVTGDGEVEVDAGAEIQDEEPPNVFVKVFRAFKSWFGFGR